MATWKELLADEMEEHGQSINDIVYTTLTPEELEMQFDGGFGSADGVPFTAWSWSRVYFPYCYDGAEGVASVPRNPSNEPTKHIGGG